MAPEPVLVLRALGLGDALAGVPALRGLRRLYPDRRLILAGRQPVAGWLLRLGLVDEVYPLARLTDRPPGFALGPHVAVNLHGRGPESHRLLLAATPAELIAFDCPAAGCHSASAWRPDEHEVRRWCRLIADAGGWCGPDDLRLSAPPLAGDRPVLVHPVLVHPGAASRSRQWPPDRWAAVVATLAADGHRVVLTGLEQERELCEAIVKAAGGQGQATGPLTLDELAATVAAAGLLVSGDTGVAHLATAFGTRSVTLFGPTPPAWWGPAIDLDRHTVLYRAQAGHLGDPHADDPDPAVLAIDVPEVLEAARLQLALVG